MLRYSVTIYVTLTKETAVTILEEFRGRYDAPPTDPAKKILFAVMGDLLSRKGFDGEWDGVDEEIQAEVLETNLDIIRKNLP